MQQQYLPSHSQYAQGSGKADVMTHINLVKTKPVILRVSVTNGVRPSSKHSLNCVTNCVVLVLALQNPKKIQLISCKNFQSRVLCKSVTVSV